MTDLILMVGVVASGKSTVANMIKSTYEHNNSHAMIVSSDNIREEVFGDINDQTHNEEVFKEVHRRINNCINKHNVIVDATNINVKNRRTILDLVRNNNNVKKIAVVMTTPIPICKMQNRKRERTVPEFVIDKQLKQFEIPFYEEGFDEIQLIGWNDGFFNNKVNEITKVDFDYVSKLMEGFDQKTHHHKYTLDVHCQKCAEELRKRTDNEILIRAGEIHDIGKLTSGELKEDGSGEYRYYSHHNVGTYELLQNLDCVGFTDIKDILRCLFYVNFHMLPFFIETDKAKKKWEKIMGKELLDDLMLFNECDIVASGR